MRATARTPLRVTALANLVNVVLAYGLIFGHFGLPALGPVGSAWATFLARGLALALLLVALWRGKGGVTISGGSWRPDFGVARQVLRIGIPAALEQVLATSAFLALALVVARLGTDVLAAQRITFNALSLSFLPGIGFGIAATALVGQSVGARRIAEGAAAARVATTLGGDLDERDRGAADHLRAAGGWVVHQRRSRDCGRCARAAGAGADAAVLGGAVRAGGRAAWHGQYPLPAAGHRHKHLGRDGVWRSR